MASSSSSSSLPPAGGFVEQLRRQANLFGSPMPEFKTEFIVTCMFHSGLRFCGAGATESAATEDAAKKAFESTIRESTTAYPPETSAVQSSLSSNVRNYTLTIPPPTHTGGNGSSPEIIECKTKIDNNPWYQYLERDSLRHHDVAADTTALKFIETMRARPNPSPSSNLRMPPPIILPVDHPKLLSGVGGAISDEETSLATAASDTFSSNIIQVESISDPISAVAKYCQRHKLPNPFYDFKLSGGSSNEPIFIGSVQWGENTFVMEGAAGDTKKSVKRVLAMIIARHMGDELFK